MSTKIYTAYKIVPQKGETFSDVLFDLQRKGKEEVKNKLIHLYGEGDFFKNSQLLRSKFIESQKTRERSIFDFSVCIAAREWKRKWYLIPFCDRVSLVTGSLDFMDSHPSLVDFGYWNNTDRPENVTSRQWRHREKVWDSLSEKWEDLLIIDILSLDSWESIHNDIFFHFMKRGERSKILGDKEGDDNTNHHNFLHNLLGCE